MDERKIGGIRKNVFFLGLVSFFNDVSNGMIQSIMPFFLAVTLGVPAAGIGLIEGVADAVSATLRIFSGWLSDTINRRKLPAFLGYFLSVSTRPLFVFAQTFSHVLAIRMADRFGKGFREPPRDALVFESADCKKDVGVSFNYLSAMDAFGAMLGPLFAFLILSLLNKAGDKAFSFNFIFLVSFAIGLIALLNFFFVKETKKSQLACRAPKFNFNFLKENRQFSSLMLSVFVFGLGMLPITLLFLRPIEIGFKLLNVSFLYFIFSAVFAVSAIPLGKLADKTGERLIIVFGFVSAICAYLILIFTNSAVFLILAFCFLGLYFGATDGLMRALAGRLILPEFLATGEGLFAAAIGYSSLFAGIIGGSLWGAFGYKAALFYSIAVSTLGFILFIYFSYGQKILKPKIGSSFGRK